MKVYLSGPIADCTDRECRDWRDYAGTWLLDHGFTPLDPMRRDYREADVAQHYREIVDLDKYDIDQCECVLVHWHKISAGTAMEILHAWAAGIPIIVVHPANVDFQLSPWVLYHSSIVVRNLEEALLWINKHFEA